MMFGWGLTLKTSHTTGAHGNQRLCPVHRRTGDSEEEEDSEEEARSMTTASEALRP